jgi:hypothetical protein
MGAWGAGTFENDTACDFAAEVAETSDLKKIQAAFDRVLAVGSGYLDAPDAEEALAAADIVARLRGNFGPQTAYTESIDTWVKKRKLAISDDLVARARQSVARVAMPPSELLELWSESDQLSTWKSSIDELIGRL